MDASADGPAMQALRDDMESLKKELLNVQVMQAQQQQQAQRDPHTRPVAGRRKSATLSRRLSLQLEEIKRSAQTDVAALHRELARLKLENNSLQLEAEVLRRGSELAKRELAIDANLRADLELQLLAIQEGLGVHHAGSTSPSSDDTCGPVPRKVIIDLEDALALLRKRRGEVASDEVSASDMSFSTSGQDSENGKPAQLTVDAISRLERRLADLEKEKRVHMFGSAGEASLRTQKSKLKPQRPTGMPPSGGRNAETASNSPRRRLKDSIVVSKSSVRKATNKQAALLPRYKKDAESAKTAGGRKRFGLLSKKQKPQVAVHVPAALEMEIDKATVVTDSIVMSKKKLEELRKAKAASSGNTVTTPDPDLDTTDLQGRRSADYSIKLGKKDSLHASIPLPKGDEARGALLAAKAEAKNDSSDVSPDARASDGEGAAREQIRLAVEDMIRRGSSLYSEGLTSTESESVQSACK